MQFKQLWIAFGIVIVVSFAVLGYYGREIYRVAPPVPDQVVTPDGETLFTGQDIKDGQNVWQSIGGQQLGSIWGHGAYVAPDWSADWLHRECLWLLNHWSNEDYQLPFAELSSAEQAALRIRLTEELRTNTYEPDQNQSVVSTDRAAAYEALSRYYSAIFGEAEEFPADIAFLADGGMTPPELRDAYAIPALTIRHADRQDDMNAFFFWTAWACATERPDFTTPVSETAGLAPLAEKVTYTNNWPAERLINNEPAGPIIVWSVISFVLLLAGIGALAWYYAVIKHKEGEPPELPARDPLLALEPTPSMRATLKYFWVVVALIVVQVGLGGVTAHYGVEATFGCRGIQNWNSAP